MDVLLDIAGLQVLQGDAHGPLERWTSILELEGHADVVVRSHQSGERCFLLILLCHAYLLVPGLCV